MSPPRNTSPIDESISTTTLLEKTTDIKPSYTREQKIKLHMEMKTLCELVKEHKLDEIKAIVTQAKAVKGQKWSRCSWEEDVEDAMKKAVLLGQIDTVQFFLEEGVSPNIYDLLIKRSKNHNRSFNSWSLVSCAAESGNLDMVKLLVQYGAKVTAQDCDWIIGYINDNNSAIRAAVVANHADIVEYLLKNGANSNCLTHNNSSNNDKIYHTTLLAKAAKNNNSRIVELLINHGASIPKAFHGLNEKYTDARRMFLTKQIEIQEALFSKQALAALTRERQDLFGTEQSVLKDVENDSKPKNEPKL